MNIEITNKKLSGEVSAISSKSHAHRVLIAAALAGASEKVQIENTSQDIEATRGCLAQLAQDAPIFDCQESGSTLRFLLPLSMALKQTATFTGAGALPQRPISPLKEQMEEHGCTFSQPAGTICTVTGQLTAGRFLLPGNVSSQFITGLLFALPLLSESSEILLSTPPQSAGYITMTLRVLESFGIHIETHTEEDVEETYSAFRIKGNQRYACPGEISIEGDWSNAAFWLAAGALSDIIPGSEESPGVSCRGLDLLSAQGDRKISAIIKAFGGNIVNRHSTVVASGGIFHGIEIDAGQIPDLIPIISVMASVASGTTRIINAERLRIKESDRLHGITENLRILGANIEELPDGLVITGRKNLLGGTVSGYNDHRIVMAMTIAALCCSKPVIITGAEAVNKSYPHFFDDFTALGGNAYVIQ